MAKARPTTERGSWSPAEFADRHGISESKLYSMWREQPAPFGTGPEYTPIGKQRRVTPQQEREWLRKLTAAQREASDPPVEIDTDARG